MQNSIVEKNFKIGCRADEITPLLEKVLAELDQVVENNCEINFKLELAAREMLANAIEHGSILASETNSDFEKLVIKVKLVVRSKELSFTVKDPGPGFDWQNYDLAEMPKFEEKGRGLKMINQVSDQMKFNSVGNEITAIFKL